MPPLLSALDSTSSLLSRRFLFLSATQMHMVNLSLGIIFWLAPTLGQSKVQIDRTARYACFAGYFPSFLQKFQDKRPRPYSRECGTLELNPFCQWHLLVGLLVPTAMLFVRPVFSSYWMWLSMIWKILRMTPSQIRIIHKTKGEAHNFFIK